jgi:hypothetical protein
MADGPPKAQMYQAAKPYYFDNASSRLRFATARQGTTRSAYTRRSRFAS